MNGGRRRRNGGRRSARLGNLLIAAALAAVAGGCGATDPFVYKEGEFNRESSRFNKPLLEGELVYVCYNGFGTTDLDVQRIAAAKCAELGRTAIRVNYEFGRCPLLTPNAEIFRCDEVAGS